MLHNKANVLVTALATAVAFTAATGTGQAAVRIPWTDQTVFALSPTDGYVAEWMGLSTGWIEIGGPAGHVYAGSAGVFDTDASGDIWEYDGTPFSWTEIGGPGKEFAEGGGHLYGLGPNGAYVAEWSGTASGGWTIIGGAAADIYAGDDGLIATAPSSNSSGDVWHYDDTTGDWADIGGHGWDFAVGDGAVYRADDDFTSVSEWTGGTSWTPILTTGTDILNLVGGDQGVYVYNYGTAGNQVFEYDGSPDHWSLISSGDGPVPEAESRSSLYGVVYGPTGPSSVEQYSGSGTGWTVIGGPADPNLAAAG